jgi:hypothetical protein
MTMYQRGSHSLIFMPWVRAGLGKARTTTTVPGLPHQTGPLLSELEPLRQVPYDVACGYRYAGCTIVLSSLCAGAAAKDKEE